MHTHIHIYIKEAENLLFFVLFFAAYMPQGRRSMVVYVGENIFEDMP